MKINSRPPQPIQPSGGDDRVKGAESRKAFELGAGEQGARSLGALRSRFTARDLDQPDKADQAVREAFAALVQDQPVSGALPEEGRKQLTDFMAQDPMLQQKMLSYLRKALL
ncbi:MAG: hypothetical protein GC160_00390 [Acidobacteria bacterium]|nr:hypothetical protein [Acidobacteriota bacterium]